jgi:choline-sulfatase
VGHDPQLFDLQADPDELKDLVKTNADQPETATLLAEGERRLREICDPDAVNEQCFADQKKTYCRIGRGGGLPDGLLF